MHVVHFGATAVFYGVLKMYYVTMYFLICHLVKTIFFANDRVPKEVQVVQVQ